MRNIRSNKLSATLVAFALVLFVAGYSLTTAGAWSTNQSATRNCDNVVTAVFKNTEPNTPSFVMDVTVDKQTKVVKGGETATWTLFSHPTQSVTFYLTWHDGHDGDDSRTVSIPPKEHCVTTTTSTTSTTVPSTTTTTVPTTSTTSTTVPATTSTSTTTQPTTTSTSTTVPSTTSTTVPTTSTTVVTTTTAPTTTTSTTQPTTSTTSTSVPTTTSTTVSTTSTTQGSTTSTSTTLVPPVSTVVPPTSAAPPTTPGEPSTQPPLVEIDSPPFSNNSMPLPTTGADTNRMIGLAAILIGVGLCVLAVKKRVI